MDTTLWVIVIVASVAGGALAPHLVKLLHKKGWIKLDGKTWEEYHSERNS